MYVLCILLNNVFSAATFLRFYSFMTKVGSHLKNKHKKLNVDKQLLKKYVEKIYNTIMSPVNLHAF